MDITYMDRINAVQHKLCEVKTWVDETLKILNYVCIDEDHKQFSKAASHDNAYKTDNLYQGQLGEVRDLEAEEDELCSS